MDAKKMTATGAAQSGETVRSRDGASAVEEIREYHGALRGASSFAPLKEGIDEDDLPLTSFFIPSQSLAHRIISHNQRLLSQDYEAEELIPDEFDLHDELEAVEPPPAPATSAAARKGASQRVIGERLYHYLAFLARHSTEESASRLGALKKGLLVMLGLSTDSQDDSSHESDRLVTELIDEFLFWLSDTCSGEYIAPWGEVYVTDGDLLLVPYIFEDEYSTEAYTPATYLPPPSDPSKTGNGA